MFLRAAQICVHPADPFGFDVNWYGSEMKMADVTQNGPLGSYYIALAASCLGWSEVAIHLALLVPAVAAVVGTYFLAARFCTNPLLAALATLLCPVFMVSSTTIMCDVILVAFWVWAVVLWLRGMDSGSAVSLICAACMIAAAAVTKYFGAALIPLLLAYSLLRWRGLQWQALYLAIPVVVLVAYDWGMRSLYGHSPLFGAGCYALGFSAAGGNLFRGAISLSYLGGCVATVIVFSPLLASRKILAIGLLIMLPVIMVVSSQSQFGNLDMPRNNRGGLVLSSQFAAYFVAGAALLALTAADLWRARDADSCLLVLWTVGTFVFCWMFNWSVNGRSILPLVPAASILIVRRLPTVPAMSERWPSFSQYVPLVPLTLLSVAVAFADLQWANASRLAAAEISTKFAGKRAIFFAGHWGFQQYMEARGCRPLENKSPIYPGDILVLPENNTNVPLAMPSAFVEIGVLDEPACGILAIMRQEVGAGFYCSLMGPLPFAFGEVPLERFTSGPSESWAGTSRVDDRRWRCRPTLAPSAGESIEPGISLFARDAERAKVA